VIKLKLNNEGFDGFESGSESEEEGEKQRSEVELKYYAQQKGMVQSVMSNYVDQIVSNLEDRFVESDQVSKFRPDFVNYKKGCTQITTASDKVYQLLAHGRWFPPGFFHH
jgi:hypothetical protein